MLKLLQIRNFALAENLTIEFQSGLNILTGETGTGKSILVGALAAALGDRVFTEVVRSGFDKANIEAVFDISHLPGIRTMLEEKGIECGQELMLRREISIKGATRAFINDSPVTITTLSEIGDYLVDIHGQHEHQSLLRQETHRYFLDSFGKLQPILSRVKEAFNEAKEIQIELLKFEEKQKNLSEKLELFLFQRDEIDKAQLQKEEDIRLEEERKLLTNSEKLHELSNRLLQIFIGDGNNLIELIGEANSSLEDLSEYSNDLKNLFREFDSARIVVTEAARSIEEFQNSLEFDPQRLEEIEARLNLISTLKKKYGTTIEEILGYRNQIANDLDTHENFEFELGNLRNEYQKALDKFKDAALDLSRQRKKTARHMEESVHEQLQMLGMSKTRFQIQSEFVEDDHGLVFIDGKKIYADQYGVDRIEYYISTNPGEEFKPLNKIISGGEVSRIMLALKSILADIDRIPTLIFDEIDLGVSGRIAQAVGRSIAKLSQLHQILCITHLPQIASQGNSHFTVEKFVKEDRTFTKVVELNEEGRVEEIARLMGGEKITETVKESARQLIEEAKE